MKGKHRWGDWGFLCAPDIGTAVHARIDDGHVCFLTGVCVMPREQGMHWTILPRVSLRYQLSPEGAIAITG